MHADPSGESGLKGLIEAAEADEYVRTAALAALAYRQLYQAADLS